MPKSKKIARLDETEDFWSDYKKGTLINDKDDDPRVELLYGNGPITPQATSGYAYWGFESALHVNETMLRQMIERYSHRVQAAHGSRSETLPSCGIDLNNSYDELLEKQLTSYRNSLKPDQGVPSTSSSTPTAVEVRPAVAIQENKDGSLLIKLKHREFLATKVSIAVVNLTEEDLVAWSGKRAMAESNRMPVMPTPIKTYRSRVKASRDAISPLNEFLQAQGDDMVDFVQQKSSANITLSPRKGPRKGRPKRKKLSVVKLKNGNGHTKGDGSGGGASLHFTQIRSAKRIERVEEGFSPEIATQAPAIIDPMTEEALTLAQTIMYPQTEEPITTEQTIRLELSTEEKILPVIMEELPTGPPSASLGATNTDKSSVIIDPVTEEALTLAQTIMYPQTEEPITTEQTIRLELSTEEKILPVIIEEIPTMPLSALLVATNTDKSSVVPMEMDDDDDDVLEIFANTEDDFGLGDF